MNAIVHRNCSRCGEDFIIIVPDFQIYGKRDEAIDRWVLKFGYKLCPDHRKAKGRPDCWQYMRLGCGYR